MVNGSRNSISQLAFAKLPHFLEEISILQLKDKVLPPLTIVFSETTTFCASNDISHLHIDNEV